MRLSTGNDCRRVGTRDGAGGGEGHGLAVSAAAVVGRATAMRVALTERLHVCGCRSLGRETLGLGRKRFGRGASGAARGRESGFLVVAKGGGVPTEELGAAVGDVKVEEVATHGAGKAALGA
ncbi:hypothetical protein F442_21953 [Phytophthora nicotianae P10297]|uniref:Uncharacterized protein n=3 Tax=Phytophthora nicotianae TaxID=4792 RepID=V9DVH0_PHYNI|nr:hypothetical protein F443_22090 [Phytophthora nicotianae P1569]ETO59567.1 hypothetical protein F444_22108 [Phytophthora nicotianae P1976]ETP28807.1 hypothetical protein F442_21953 [Phytophthora nicotianae P10297]